MRICKNRTKRKGVVRFILVTILTVLSIILILSFNIIDLFDKNNDTIHSYILTISSVMGGFMFAGLGILVSTISNDEVKRFWNGHYLDNLYRVSVWGLLCDVLAIIFSTVILYVNYDAVEKIFGMQNFDIIIYRIKIINVILATLGMIYFIWSVIMLVRVLKILKKDQFGNR